MSSFKTKEQAEHAGLKVLVQMPRGWKLRVWNNLGWHFSVYFGVCQIYQDIYGKDVSYSCLISSEPHQRPGAAGGGPWTTRGISHKTPVAALEAEAAAFKEYQSVRQSLFDLIGTKIDEAVAGKITKKKNPIKI
jgi:hypothetical protein